MQKIAFIITFTILTYKAFSQSYEGKIIDIYNNKLSFVNAVILTPKDSSYITGTVSQEDGTFKFRDLPSKGLLVFSAIGYKKNIFNLEHFDTHRKTIVMEPSVENLKQITITSKSKQIELNNGKLTFHPIKDFLNESDNGNDLVSFCPSITFINNRISIIGNKKPAVIMINGKILPQNQATLILDNLNAKSIKRIEVTDSNSSEIDGNIQGGVINIVVNNFNPGTSINIQSSTTIYNNKGFNQRQGAIASFGGPKWKLYGNYFFSTGNKQQDNKNNGSTTKFLESDFIVNNQLIRYNNKPRSLNYNFGGLTDIGKHSIGIDVQIERSFPKESLYEKSVKLKTLDYKSIDLGYATSKSLFLGERENYSLYYNFLLDSLKSNIKIEGNLLRNNDSYSNDINTHYEIDKQRGISEKNLSLGHGVDKYLKWDLNKNFKNGLKINFGMKYNNASYRSEVTSNTIIGEKLDDAKSNSKYNYTENILGLYSKIGIHILGIDVNTGFRIEKTSLNGTSNNVGKQSDSVIKNNVDYLPYINLFKKIDRNRSLNLSYSNSLWRPSFSLLTNYYNRISDNYISMGNPNLESARIYKLKLKYREGNHSIILSGDYTNNLISQKITTKNKISYHTNTNDGTQLRIVLGYVFSGKLYRWWYCTSNVYSYYQRYPNNFSDKEEITYYISTKNRFTICNNLSVDLYSCFQTSAVQPSAKLDRIYYSNLGIHYSLLNSRINADLLFNDVFNTKKTVSIYSTKDLKYEYYKKDLTQYFMIKLSYRFHSKNKISTRTLRSGNQNSYRF